MIGLDFHNPLSFPLGNGDENDFVSIGYRMTACADLRQLLNRSRRDSVESVDVVVGEWTGIVKQHLSPQKSRSMNGFLYVNGSLDVHEFQYNTGFS